MGSVKKNKRYVGLKKYNKLVSTLVKDRKKRKEAYDISEIRSLASSIYPNFKETSLKGLKKKDILSAKPTKLLPTQRKYVKEVEPDLIFPEELSSLEDRYYFDLFDMLGVIETQTSNNIFFVSTIKGSENLEFQGGNQLPPSLDIFYQKNFSQFVKYIDTLRSKNKIDYDSIRIIATPPKKEKGKYVSYIIITNSEGEKIDDETNDLFDGFDPTVDYSFLAPAKEIKGTKPKKESEITDIDFEIKKEQIKANKEVEMARLKQIDKYYQDALSGKISWERYDKMIEDLYRK